MVKFEKIRPVLRASMKSMRISESPFRCPFPTWLMVITNTLPPLSAFILCCVWLEDFRTEWWSSVAYVFVFIVSFWGILCLPYTIYREFAWFVILAASVWTALPMFGIGYAIVLGLLLIPYYHTLVLGWCFARQERKKLQSLVGREGITICRDAPFNMVVGIDVERKKE